MKKILRTYRFTAFGFLLILILVDCLSRDNYLLNRDVWFSEIGIIEISAALILALCIVVTVLTAIKSVRREKEAYCLRILLFSFLLYEELSFMSANAFEFTKKYNSQYELNIHNSQFLKEPVFGGADFFGFTPTWVSFITLASCLFIAYGGCIFRSQRLQPIFCVKQLRAFFLIFVMNFVLLSSLKVLGIIEDSGMFFDSESQETFLYLVMLLDSNAKLLSIRKNHYKL